MTDYWKAVDAVSMERKTNAVAVAQADAKKKKETSNAKAPRVKTCVFSRTIDRIDDEGAELVKDDVVDFVGELKQQFGRKICLMGGGELAQSLLGAELVGEVGLNIHHRLFATSHQWDVARSTGSSR